MKITGIIVAAVLIAGSGLTLHVAQSQQPGVKRTDLLRHDLDVSGREVIQVRVDFAHGVAFPPHSHPGEEIAYVSRRPARIPSRRQATGDTQAR